MRKKEGMAIKKISRKSNSRQHFEGELNLLKCRRSNSRKCFEMVNLNFAKSLRSQITIFVIIGIIIVAALIALFSYIIPRYLDSIKAPEARLDECLQKSINSTMPKILLKGGNLNPELYFNYNGESIDYLCYTSEYYKTCTMQNPFIKQSIENEARKSIVEDVQACIISYTDRLKSSGYSVVLSPEAVSFNVEIVPGKIIVSVNNSISAKKGTESISRDKITSEMASNLYEILMVASSIQNFEARYGDSVPETYMFYYKNLKVEKKRQSDSSKIYIITDRKTGEKFQFAVRSLAWPPGYALPA